MSILGLSAHATGQELKPQEKAAAKAAFNAGLALEAAGDYAQALTKFREFNTIKTTPQGLYHVALCLERVGKWTEALGTYRMAIERAEDVRAKDVQEKADEGRKSLEQRLPKLTIQRGKGADAASISLDGVLLGATAIGTEMPVDPGPHTLVAKVSGRNDYRSDIKINESEQKTIVVEFTDGAVAPPPTASATVAEQPQKKPMSPARRNSYIVLGAGAGAVVVAGVFFILRESTISTLQDKCIDDHCPSSSKSTADKGKLYTVLGDAFLGLGVVGLGVGTYLWVSSKDSSTSTQKASIMISPGAPGSPAGASIGGRF